MGLVFALQPDIRRSSTDQLVIRSSKRKFGLGGSFVFGGALLGTMFLAASPLFKIFWTQGGLIDRIITLLVITPIVLYPLMALACWFYEEVVVLRRENDGRYSMSAQEQVFGLRWNRREAHDVKISDLAVENWMGSRNVAALAAARKGKQDRYGTRGHWMLILKQGDQEILLERRAKRDDIDLLLAQIQAHFPSA